MDADQPPVIDPGAGAHVSYLRRAQALLATRAELFAAGPRPSKRTGALTAVRAAGPQRDRAAARQLSLPLPLERRHRRARMLS